MAAKQPLYAIVAGVGPGTGRSVALKFAKAYPVALLSRRPESYQSIVDEIRKAGGQAVGISTDITSQESVDAAFARLKKEPHFAGAGLAAAVYNASSSVGSFLPFLETEASELDRSLATSARGFYLFAKSTLPLLLDSVPTSPHPPSLIVTGATASLRGGARFGNFAAGKFAQRALAQSLSREFHPRGVHVANVIIDAVIDVPKKGVAATAGPANSKIKPEDIADEYWHLHTQTVTAFTQELDLRPSVEKF